MFFFDKSKKLKSFFKTSKSDSKNFDSPDLLLITCPGWELITPPLSLATLSATTRAKGYKTLALDLNLEFQQKCNRRFRDYWDPVQLGSAWSDKNRVQLFIDSHTELIEKTVKHILAINPSVIGFSGYFTNYQMSVKFSELIRKKRPDIKIIFGGPNVSRLLFGKEAVKHDFIDAAAQGEGEDIIIDFLEHVKAGKPLDTCRGILFKRGSEIVDTGDRALARTLDEMPFSDFSDFDLTQYIEPLTVPLMMSRGCPNKCIYCTEKVYWRTYRGRTPESLVNEIELHVKNYGINKIQFADSLLNGNIKYLERFCELIVERKIKVEWAGQAVIRKEMTYDLFKKLKAAGCSFFGYGAETTSEMLMIEIGKLLSKGADIDRLVEDSHRAGVGIGFNFMFGVPGETDADSKNILEFVRKHKGHFTSVNPSPAFCTFDKGTPGGDFPEKYGMKPTKFNPFWESIDGSITFLTRLQRFEAFCSLTSELGIKSSYPHPQMVDRDFWIGFFHFEKRQYEESIPFLERWIVKHPEDADSKKRLNSAKELVAKSEKVFAT